MLLLLPPDIQSQTGNRAPTNAAMPLLTLDASSIDTEPLATYVWQLLPDPPLLITR